MTAEAWAAGAVVRKDSSGSGVVAEVVVGGNDRVRESAGDGGGKKVGAMAVGETER